MKCDPMEINLSMYLDDELDERTRKIVETHLQQCEVCKNKYNKLRKVSQEVSAMPISEPQDEIFDRFESHVFSKIERGVGWMLLSIGAIFLAATGAFYLFRDFLLDAGIALPIRIGVGLSSLGALVLFVSTARHKITTYKKDKYRKVIR